MQLERLELPYLDLGSVFSCVQNVLQALFSLFGNLEVWLTEVVLDCECLFVDWHLVEEKRMWLLVRSLSVLLIFGGIFALLTDMRYLGGAISAVMFCSGLRKQLHFKGSLTIVGLCLSDILWIFRWRGQLQAFRLARNVVLLWVLHRVYQRLHHAAPVTGVLISKKFTFKVFLAFLEVAGK